MKLQKFLGRSSTKPSGAQSGKEVSYDYTDTLGFVCSSTSRFNEPHGAAPPQGSVAHCYSLGSACPMGQLFLLGIVCLVLFQPLGSVGPIV